jgi:Peptide methionine sulfoxide reductase
MIETTEKAILAGDCFWGMQDLLRKRPDVISTRVGYTGGDVPNATYRHHGTHRGDRDRLRPPADLPRTRVLARTPTQLTLLRLGDLDRLTGHDPNVRRGYDNSSSPRRTYFREPVLAIGVAGARRFEPRRRLGSTISTLVHVRRSSLHACNRPFAPEINERRLPARHGLRTPPGARDAPPGHQG